MVTPRLARVALALMLVSATRPAIAASGSPPQAAAQPSAAKLQDIPGKAEALAFLEAIAAGNSANAYKMLSDAKQRRMTFAQFSEAVAPLTAAGITNFHITSAKTATSSFGYDSDFGFHRTLRKAALAGTFATRRGRTEMTLGLVATSETWHIHNFEFAASAVEATRVRAEAAAAEQGCFAGPPSNPNSWIDACSRVLALDPRRSTAYFNRSVGYIDTGEYDRAVADLLEYTRQVSLSPSAALQLGRAYDAKRDHERAIGYFTRAIEAKQHQSEVIGGLFGRAMAHEALGRPKPSRADLDTATNLDRKLVAALYMQRGFALCRDRRFDEAIAAFDGTIVLNPTWLSAYAGRGASYDGKGDKDRAIADYRKALEFQAKGDLEVRRQREARERLQALGART